MEIGQLRPVRADDDPQSVDGLRDTGDARGMSNRIDSDTSRGLGLRLTAAAVMGALLTASAYWPGLMTWDPVRQYGEALSGQIDDWHPPAMQWLWRQLLAVHSGPAPMLIMQLALY
jgi:hypothetical protein